jgi:methylmalonyl-CoA/ethylmalonyl-CoA epimerase
MLEKLDHIGIAVKDLDQAMKLYREAFGIEPDLVYESSYTKAKIAFFPVGEVRIELIQPVDPESVVGKFLEKRGEGIHHISYRVKDVDGGLAELEKKGILLIDKKSRRVRENERVAFLHPKSTNGVLVELIQEDRDLA